MSAPTRLVIADDHRMFRQGLVSNLRLHSRVSVVGEVERADDLASALQRLEYDVLLLDLQMDRNVLCDVETLAERVPIVVVTANERTDAALGAIRAGARAVVFKRFAIETLLAAVDAVVTGQLWVPPELRAAVVATLREPRRPALTRREREIVAYVARGLRNAEVADRLSITEVTVKSHVNNVFHKLGLRDRVELALYAVRVGLVEPHEGRAC
jgi:DNA-binding NarL/FixJ family response regulator